MNHKLLKKAREELGLTQSQLASVADVPRSQIQLLEKGGNVTLQTLEKIVSAMGISLVLVSRDEVAAMREALRSLDGVLARIGAQVIAQSPFDPQRLLVMTRELEEFVRAMQGDAASAPPAAERGEKG